MKSITLELDLYLIYKIAFVYSFKNIIVIILSITDLKHLIKNRILMKC